MAIPLFRDLALINVVAIVLATLLYLIGWSPINAISVSLLILCALLLIFGGAIGFFLTSTSFESLQKIFRRSKEKVEESQIEKRREKYQTKADERKEQVNFGKRLIIFGFILLGESLLISLIYVLI